MGALIETFNIPQKQVHMNEQTVLSAVLTLLVTLGPWVAMPSARRVPKSRHNGLTVDPIAYAWRALHGVNLPRRLRGS